MKFQILAAAILCHCLTLKKVQSADAGGAGDGGFLTGPSCQRICETGCDAQNFLCTLGPRQEICRNLQDNCKPRCAERCACISRCRGGCADAKAACTGESSQGPGSANAICEGSNAICSYAVCPLACGLRTGGDALLKSIPELFQAPN